MSSIPIGWVQQPDGSYSKAGSSNKGLPAFTLNVPSVTVSAPKKIIDPKTGRITFKDNPPKRIRQSSKPLMNKMETEYWLALCNIFGEDKVKPQAIRLRLGNGIWFKPDFLVFFQWTDDVITKRIRCYEVKGPWAFRGGFENLKVAAGLYPEICFILAWKDKSTKQWREQIVLP